MSGIIFLPVKAGCGWLAIVPRYVCRQPYAATGMFSLLPELPRAATILWSRRFVVGCTRVLRTAWERERLAVGSAVPTTAGRLVVKEVIQ
jgi:hypothetical protein